MKIAILGGTGSLGTIIGGLIAKNGYDVKYVKSSPDNCVKTLIHCFQIRLK